jgi:hypothetical protein
MAYQFPRFVPPRAEHARLELESGRVSIVSPVRRLPASSELDAAWKPGNVWIVPCGGEDDRGCQTWDIKRIEGMVRSGGAIIYRQIRTTWYRLDFSIPMLQGMKRQIELRTVEPDKAT